MEAAEEGSKAWESAQEKWQAAVENLNSNIESSIETLQEKYLNMINSIFEKLNNNITNNKGLDYVSEEWDLINKNADQYLDSLNAMYSVQTLQSKYLDAIDNTNSISAQQKLNDLMNDEISLLKEQDKLSQYDIDRAEMRYEIAMKQIALEEAQQNKSTLRLRRDTQGNYSYQYTADQDEVSKLQQELSDLYNQLYNLDAGQYKDNLNQLYDVWNEFQEKMAEAAQINDPEKRAERELLIQEQYGELINSITKENEDIKNNLYQSTMSELFDLYSQNVDNYDFMTSEQQALLDQFLTNDIDLNNAAFDNLFNLYNTNLDAFRNMTDEQIDLVMNSMVPQWDSGVQQMADKLVGEGGFQAIYNQLIEDLKVANSEYEQDIIDLAQSVTGKDGLSSVTDAYAALEEAVKGNISIVEDYMDTNDEVISKNQEVMDSIQAVVDTIDKMTQAYENAANAASKAVEESWNL